MFLRKPYAAKTDITSHFNRDRIHPVSGELKPHLGTDISLTEGTKLIAPIGGVITNHINKGGLFVGYGRYCQLWAETVQGTKILMRFAHLSECCVEDKSKIKKGDTIALSGNTGIGTGAHLHLELLIYDEDLAEYIAVDTLNKIDYYDKGNHSE